MKKNLFLLILVLTSTMAVKAQLTNSSWAGRMSIPSDVAVVLNFKTDTLLLMIPEMGIVGETMSYKVKDSVITLKKISGNSPCDSAAFTLSYKIEGNQLSIKPLVDPCYDRANAWTGGPFIRQ